MRLVSTCMALMMLLSGCVVADIYRPEASDGKLRETGHNYSSGPGRWDEIEFSRNKVRLRVQATEVQGDLTIHATYLVPDGVSAQLVSLQFLLKEENRETSIEAKNVNIFSPDGHPLHGNQAPAKPMPGKTVYLSGSAFDLSYEISFWVPAHQPRRAFTLAVPQLKINEELVSFPEIHFTPGKAIY